MSRTRWRSWGHVWSDIRRRIGRCIGLRHAVLSNDMLHKAAKYWLRFIRVRAIYQQQAGSVRGGFTDAVVSCRKFTAVTGTEANGCGTGISSKPVSVRGGFTDAVVSCRKFTAVTGTGADGCGTKIVQLRNVNRKFYNSLGTKVPGMNFSCALCR